jgi:hypothetical protein
MVHYGDPQWYHDNVLPYRDRFWPEEASLYVSPFAGSEDTESDVSVSLQRPPRNAADLKSELAELRQLRLTNKERREQGLPPLPPPVRTSTSTSSSSSSSPPASSTAAEDIWRPSLRDGASLGTTGMKSVLSEHQPAQKVRTWRETWQEATERHVV